jgi:geranylgeranyl pyrophosphate synthase
MLPVYLVMLANRVIHDNPLAAYERRVEAAAEINNAGLQMTQGQELDLTQHTQTTQSAEHLLERYRLKSGAIYAAAAKAGAILCGAGAEEAELLASFGMTLGVSYQFLDDVADAASRSSELGKRPGMDSAKFTAVDQFGADGAGKSAQDLKEEALAKLDQFGSDADLLRDLAAHARLASSA